MQTYLEIDEFCKLVHLDREVIEKYDRKRNTKFKRGKMVLFI